MDYYTGSGSEIAAAGVISATDEDAGATLAYSIDQSMLAPNQDYFAVQYFNYYMLNSELSFDKCFEYSCKRTISFIFKLYSNKYVRKTCP